MLFVLLEPRARHSFRETPGGQRAQHCLHAVAARAVFASPRHVPARNQTGQIGKCVRNHPCAAKRWRFASVAGQNFHREKELSPTMDRTFRGTIRPPGKFSTPGKAETSSQSPMPRLIGHRFAMQKVLVSRPDPHRHGRAPPARSTTAEVQREHCHPVGRPLVSVPPSANSLRSNTAMLSSPASTLKQVSARRLSCLPTR